MTTPAERQGRGFVLVPLDCPSCGAAVAAEGEDVVYYCTACRNGYRFDEAERRLVPVEVSFVVASGRAVERYLPFWLQPATVTVHERQAAGQAFRGLMRFFLGGEEGGSGGEGRFVVPAFRAGLRSVVRLTSLYTQSFPDLGERLGERLTGGCYGVEDVRKLAHYSLISSEVDKPDLLQNLRYEIEFGEPRLLGVPFARHGDGWADALFGEQVTLPAARDRS